MLPPLAGIDPAEWSTMVRKGLDEQVLDADELTHVLRHVELSSDALRTVERSLAVMEIRVDDSIDEDSDIDLDIDIGLEADDDDADDELEDLGDLGDLGDLDDDDDGVEDDGVDRDHDARVGSADRRGRLEIVGRVEVTGEVAVLDTGRDLLDEDRAAEIISDADEEWLAARRRAQRKPLGNRGATSTSDSVRMYLRSIGQVDLLSAEDERRLAQMIEAGHVAAERLAGGSDGLSGLSGVGARRLRADVRRGESAKSELTQANLRLVVSIAKRYSGRGMHLLDLIQEGNLGLMRAVDKFDHTKGFKFSTYATWWIRQAITRSIADQSRTIRIPVHMVEHMNRVTRARRQMHQELEREPTVDELAAKVQLEPERVRELLRMSLDPLSLDSPVGDEDASILGDFIEDESADEPSDAATRAMLAQVVGDVLDDLSVREQEIVRMRFGLDGSRAQTLEEVGKAFGVTRERIRQIEVKTLAKLRQPVRAQRLREFLEME